MLKRILEACAQFKYSRDLDFGQVFEGWTGVRVSDIAALNEHDIEKMIVFSVSALEKAPVTLCGTEDIDFFGLDENDPLTVSKNALT